MSESHCVFASLATGRSTVALVATGGLPSRWWRLIAGALHALVAMLAVASPLVAQPVAWNRHTIDSSSRGADGVRLADVNGDGLSDIATGWEEGGVIRVYINPGSDKATEAWPAVTVGRVNSPEDALLADLDGDGSLDVVSCCEGRTRSIFIHWAPRQADDYLDPKGWSTQAFPTTAGKQMWMFAMPLDIDGRNGIDLVVGSKGPGATIGWLQSPTDARDVAAWTFHPLRDAGWIMSLQAHDMDNDGDADVVASDRKGAKRGVFWLENPGPEMAATGEAWREHPIGGSDREVMFLGWGDLNRDGRNEIVSAVRGGGLTWFQYSGPNLDSWQSFEIAMPPECGTGKGVGIGDINGDGQVDLVFTCENAVDRKSGVRWLAYSQSVEDTVWVAHEISGSEGVKFDRLELLDLDADGDLDVLTCEERDNLGVIWYENPYRQ